MTPLRVILGVVLGALIGQPCSVSYPRQMWAKGSGAQSKLFAFERNGRVGFIDPTGKIVVKPKIKASIDDVGDFVDGRARIGHTGYISESGKWAIRGDYFWSYDFAEGLGQIQVPDPEGPYGYKRYYLDRAGATVAVAAGQRSYAFSDGLALYEAQGKPGLRSFEPGNMVYRDYPGLAGFMNRTGEPVIEARFGDAGSFVDGLARATLDGNCYIVASNGTAQGSPTTGYPTSCGGVPEGVTTFCPAGFIDKTGEFVIEPQFRSAMDFSEGLAGVLVQDKWGFIDRTGRFVVEPHFDRVLPYQEGLAAVRVDGAWGFIDKAGVFVIPPQFEDVESFADSLAIVHHQDAIFYIDRQGQTVISGPYLEATPFVHGLAAVRLTDRHVSYINKSGVTVFDYFRDEPKRPFD